MRTDDEILARIYERQPHDFFGFEINDLVICLPFDKARELLRDDAEEEHWKVEPRDRESMLKIMLDYMPFAWEKANNFRSLSAMRSMAHYDAWTWLAGDTFSSSGYEYYGKDKLVELCVMYGWDHTQWDDGVRLNSEP